MEQLSHTDCGSGVLGNDPPTRVSDGSNCPDQSAIPSVWKFSVGPSPGPRDNCSQFSSPELSRRLADTPSCMQSQSFGSLGRLGANSWPSLVGSISRPATHRIKCQFPVQRRSLSLPMIAGSLKKNPFGTPACLSQVGGILLVPSPGDRMQMLLFVAIRSLFLGLQQKIASDGHAYDPTSASLCLQPD